MFINCPPMTDEDKANIALGYLPNISQIAQIIAAPSWYAHFKTAAEDDYFEPLMAWAILRNGNALPMVFEPKRRACVIAFAITGFVRIIHGDDIVDDDEDDDNDDDNNNSKEAKI